MAVQRASARWRPARPTHRADHRTAHPFAQRIKLAPEQAIFLFVADGILPASVATLQAVSNAPTPHATQRHSPNSTPRPALPHPVPRASRVAQVYDQYADEDGFLYMKYSGENTFGAVSL